MTERLNILRIAPPVLPISSNLKYAGTERVIFELHRNQRRLGHNVYLAASGDSDVGEGLIPTISESMWKQQGSNRREIKIDPEELNKHYNEILNYLKNGYGGTKFDIAHDHNGTAFTTSQEYLLERDNVNIPIIVTLHGGKSNWDLKEYMVWRALREIEGKPIYFNAISNHQREMFESVLPIETMIYHGVDIDKYTFKNKKGDYLFWIGNIHKNKGPHNAIKIAQKMKRPLIIAGEVHSGNEGFYKEMVEPYVDRFLRNGNSEKTEIERNNLVKRLETGERIVNDGEVFNIGPVNDDQKISLFRNAYATLVPNEWDEPFGLMMIESMATGTPVIGFGLGSVPEVIGENGKAGYVIEPIWEKSNGNKKLNIEAMVDETVHVLKNMNINPKNPRIRVEEQFSSEIEAGKYIEFFREILEKAA